MGLNKLGNLYREVILDHAQQPRNKRKLSQYTHQMELLNPTCGDAIIVQCQVVDGQIQAVAFDGYGCSISMASASMMTQVISGQTIDKALELVGLFNQLISGKQQDTNQLAEENEEALEEAFEETLEEMLKDAYFLEGLKQFPSRYKCGVLAWKALEMGLEHPMAHQAIIDEGAPAQARTKAGEQGVIIEVAESDPLDERTERTEHREQGAITGVAEFDPLDDPTQLDQPTNNTQATQRKDDER